MNTSEQASGSGSGSGSGMTEMFSCTMPSTFSPDSISNGSAWVISSEQTISYIAAFILSVMCLVAFVWNIVILVTYCYKYHLLKHPANIFLFALALNDLLVSVAIVPPSVVTFAAREFIIGNTDSVRCGFCYFQGFLIVFCSVVSINVLAILSIDRCLHLSNPLTYRNKESPLVGVIVMIAVWIFSFLLCILPAFGFGEWEFNVSIAACMARFTPTENLYFMFVVVTYCLVPIFVLAITNIWTYKIVSKFLSKRRVRRSSYRGSIKEKREDNSQHQQQQKQLVKVFGALFIANIVIWSPLVVMVFVVFLFTDDIPSWLYVIFWIMVSSNSMVHPILESFFNKELRVQVSRGKKKVSKTVRSTSRSLIRMATRESMMRKASVLSDMNECSSTKDTEAGNDSVFLNTTELSDFSRTPSLRGGDTPPDKRLQATDRMRRTGAPPSPLTKRHTSPLFNYPSQDHKDSKKLSVGDHSSVFSPTSNHSPSPLLTDSSKQSNPTTPVKKRQVSISLPDDENVYYPSKIVMSPTDVQQSTVFEEDDVVLPDDDVILPDDDVILPDDDVILPGDDHPSNENGALNNSTVIDLDDVSLRPNKVNGNMLNSDLQHSMNGHSVIEESELVDCYDDDTMV